MANTKAIGVAYEDQRISGGTVDNTPVGASTASTGAFTALSASGAATFDGAATFNGAATLTALSASGAATFDGAATFNGAATLNGNVAIGNAATDLVGFHGATAVDQAAYQASLSINALSVSGVVGFTSSTSLSALVETVNSLIALLVEKGLMAAA